jgi:hypothetical protein
MCVNEQKKDNNIIISSITFIFVDDNVKKLFFSSC